MLRAQSVTRWQVVKDYAHLDFDTEHTLPEHDVSDGVVNVVNGRLTGVDDEAISELHGLCTGSTELARDDNLAALRARLHNEAEDTVACPGVV